MTVNVGYSSLITFFCKNIVLTVNNLNTALSTINTEKPTSYNRDYFYAIKAPIANSVEVLGMCPLEMLDEKEYSEEYYYHENGAIKEINKEENANSSRIKSTLRFDENGNQIYLQVTKKEKISEIEKTTEREEVYENGKILKHRFNQYNQGDNNSYEYYEHIEEFYNSGMLKFSTIDDSRKSTKQVTRFTEDGKISEQELHFVDCFGIRYITIQEFRINGQLKLHTSIMVEPGARKRLYERKSNEFYEDGKIKKYSRYIEFGDGDVFVDETMNYNRDGEPVVEK